MEISFSRSLPEHKNVLVDADITEIVDPLELLGMTVGKDLKWNTHIDLLIKKTVLKTVLYLSIKTGQNAS